MSGGSIDPNMAPRAHAYQNSGLARFGIAPRFQMPAYTPVNYSAPSLAPRRIFEPAPAPVIPTSPGVPGGGGDGVGATSGGASAPSIDTSTSVPGPTGTAATVGLSALGALVGVPPGLTVTAINANDAANASAAAANATNGIGLAVGNTPTGDAFSVDSPAQGIAPSAPSAPSIGSSAADAPPGISGLDGFGGGGIGGASVGSSAADAPPGVGGIDGIGGDGTGGGGGGGGK